MSGCAYQNKEQKNVAPPCPSPGCYYNSPIRNTGARPVFGPAARSLPQLPLGLNADGEIIARADFSSPVGPGFWDRDR